LSTCIIRKKVKVESMLKKLIRAKQKNKSTPVLIFKANF